MTRRVRGITTREMNFIGKPAICMGIGVAAVVGVIYCLKPKTDQKIEITKRHHPSGVGHTSVNTQFDIRNAIARKFMNVLQKSPNGRNQVFRHPAEFQYSRLREGKRI